jgi:hypothetical protein
MRIKSRQIYVNYLVCRKDLFNKLISTFEQGFNIQKTS